ncbi:MAG TPA: hypothetical protein VE131_10300 [Terriglobales bacterium]|nr:hypothetical protein [Terriglobales bacterium]
MATDANMQNIVRLLVEVAKLDTVYRDVHLRRARELLSPVLDELAYRAIGSTEKEVEELTRRSRMAVLHRDWQQVSELSEQIGGLRERLAKIANLAAIGKEVYEAEAVAFEPFSPGKHLGPQAEAAQPGQLAQVVEHLASLSKLDIGASAFYERRRGYFASLEVQSASASQKGQQVDRAQAERLALDAAERGDVAALQRLAKELRDWKESEVATACGSGLAMMSRYECPVHLCLPFPPQVVERARQLGLAEVRTAPFAELARVREVIYTYVDQRIPSSPDMEREGVLRARAQAELGLPAELDTEEARVLAGQFVQQVFINSGGARYLPPLSAETVLLEDFAENDSAKAPSELLRALELAQRNGRSRTEIETALMRFGPGILEKNLGLDPLEFRLICIPYDLYARFGRNHNFGKWPHWTHFDGYRVMAGNRLRALAGGDGRFGGLSDLVSISPDDARDGVYARFAVVRRARMTLRWR